MTGREPFDPGGGSRGRLGTEFPALPGYLRSIVAAEENQKPKRQGRYSVQLVCPLCFKPGMSPQGLGGHLRNGHGITNEEAKCLVADAPMDPTPWLDELEETERRLDWIRARMSAEEGAALESLRLACQVFESKRKHLLERGHVRRGSKRKKLDVELDEPDEPLDA